jgi:hypothetical protein
VRLFGQKRFPSARAEANCWRAEVRQRQCSLGNLIAEPGF